LHIYTVDPGAHAMARELVPIMRETGRFGSWFADGWSAMHEGACRPAIELPEALVAGDALILGSQTDFSHTQTVIRQAAAAGAKTIFIFDHWKNYAEHFGAGALTDAIVVPDAFAREQLVFALGERAASRGHVLPHLAIEAAAERIATSGVRAEIGLIAVMLDPTEAADGLGYDWRSTLAVIAERAAQQKGVRIVVKPHPRQDAATVAGELSVFTRRGVPAHLDMGDVESLIKRASEVWGMTTVALNVALAVGKPIKSFQVGRNAAGARASNPHIEPFAVT